MEGISHHASEKLGSREKAQRKLRALVLATMATLGAATGAEASAGEYHAQPQTTESHEAFSPKKETIAFLQSVRNLTLQIEHPNANPSIEAAINNSVEEEVSMRFDAYAHDLAYKTPAYNGGQFGGEVDERMRVYARECVTQYLEHHPSALDPISLGALGEVLNSIPGPTVASPFPPSQESVPAPSSPHQEQAQPANPRGPSGQVTPLSDL